MATISIGFSCFRPRREAGTFIPLLEHSLSYFGELWVLFDVNAGVRSGLGNGLIDARQSVLRLIGVSGRILPHLW
jgi:hypothetical protein